MERSTKACIFMAISNTLVFASIWTIRSMNQCVDVSIARQQLSAGIFLIIAVKIYIMLMYDGKPDKDKIYVRVFDAVFRDNLLGKVLAVLFVIISVVLLICCFIVSIRCY